MSNSLLIWARRAFTPINPFPLNHTWVTTYQNPGPPDGFTERFPTDEHYWYCWGDLHSGGDRYQQPQPYRVWKGPANADLRLASCICQSCVQSNRTSPAWPHAGIEGKYGHNGVCHQVANRILWSAGIQQDGTALTVEGVRGWQLGWDFFGGYGYRDDSSNWQEVLGRCMQLGPNELELIARMNSRRPRLRSEGAFERVRSILKDVLKDKDRLDSEHDDGFYDARKHAIAVNELAHRYLKESLAVLGKKDFIEHFGIELQGESLPTVVDPEVAALYERLEAKAAA